MRSASSVRRSYRGSARPVWWPWGPGRQEQSTHSNIFSVSLQGGARRGPHGGARGGRQEGPLQPWLQQVIEIA